MLDTLLVKAKKESKKDKVELKSVKSFHRTMENKNQSNVIDVWPTVLGES